MCCFCCWTHAPAHESGPETWSVCFKTCMNWSLRLVVSNFHTTSKHVWSMPNFLAIFQINKTHPTKLWFFSKIFLLFKIDKVLETRWSKLIQVVICLSKPLFTLWPQLPKTVKSGVLITGTPRNMAREVLELWYKWEIFHGMQQMTGWWFGTSILFSQKYWVSNHPNWLSYFSEEFNPPTRWW